MTDLTPNELLRRAQDGDEEAWGRLLEHYRPYLRFIAQRRMDPKLQARVDASDVVQQTYLEAQRDLAGFRGEVEQELIAWLRRILEHNVSECVERHLTTKKRSAKREQSMDDSRGRGVPMRGLIPAEQSTPSQRVMRGGSFGFGSRQARTTHRDAGTDQASGAGLGFRCVVREGSIPPEWRLVGE